MAGTHVIDFERGLGDARMFVIVGPTGAGKSTLLDAVALALFGETPRLSNGRGDGGEDLDARHVMTRGAGRCRATLEFSALQAGEARQRWRATWSCRRANQQPDGALQRPVRALERWLPGEDRWLLVVDDDRRKVFEPAFVEALCGLGVDEFQRSMLLAQGEFAALLTATPADKGAILERLTSTEAYLMMGRRADETREAGARLERLEEPASHGAPPSDELAAQRARVAEHESRASALDAGCATPSARCARPPSARRWLRRWPPSPRSGRGSSAIGARARCCPRSTADVHLAAASAQRAARLEQELAQRDAELAADARRAAADALPDRPAGDGLAERRARVAELRAEQRRPSASPSARPSSRPSSARSPPCRRGSRPCARRTRFGWPSQRPSRGAGGRRAVPAVRRARASAGRRQVRGRGRGRRRGRGRARQARLRTLEVARRALDETLAKDRAASARAEALTELVRAEEGALAMAEGEARRAHEAEQARRGAELAARRAAAADALSEARATAIEADLRVLGLLAPHAATSVAELEQALLPATVRDQLEGQIARLDARREALAPAPIASAPTAPETTPETSTTSRAALGARVARLGAERAEAWQALGAAKQALAQLEARHARSTPLRGAWEAARAKADQWRRLHRLIGERDGQAFREYAQIMNLEVLVECANRHLRALAPRFRLAAADDRSGRPRLDFAVRDMMQAGRVRPITTLSGGETFLVSLALALGLADLRTSELPIETLLLDEGFGTLDGDALDQALGALEELQARTGLQLGIISHVTAVSERIAARISVEPLGQGRSRVTTELAGS
ncbi:MAG: SMC family ATPase [Myxococcota bacterium]